MIFLVALANEPQSAAPPTDVVMLGPLTVRTTDNSLPARTAALPSQHVRTPRTFKEFTATTEFVIDHATAHRVWALYIPSFAHGGEISLNGVQVAQVPTSTPTTTVWHNRPFLFTVPHGILRDGSNRMELRWAAGESLTLMSVMALGPMQALEPIHSMRLFWQNTMALLALVHALLIAAILLGLYSLRLHQMNARCLGMSALGFSILMLAYLLPSVPSWVYPYWRSVHIGGIGLFTSGICMFLIHETQTNNRWFLRVCLFWSTLGPLVYLLHFALTDTTSLGWFETGWGAVSGLIGIYPVGLLLVSLCRQWAWRRFIFLLAALCAIAIGMGAPGSLLQPTTQTAFGSIGYGQKIVLPLWIAALTAILVVELAKSMMRADEQGKRMASELQQQAKELRLQLDTQQHQECEQAALKERQRIMQDLHDGLGSQLISSLALSERGHLSVQQTSILLRECIDDLRLAIDTFSGENDQFSVAVSNLRFRMSPRLAAAGILLHWDCQEWANEAAVTAAQALPLLRIMQESFTNTLKHANAKNLSVTLRSTLREMHMVIEDDGCGFDPASTFSGRGLNNMGKRAHEFVGAEFRVTSTPTRSGLARQHCGTRIALTLPLNPGLLTDHGGCTLPA